jgi:hypothetical protein
MADLDAVLEQLKQERKRAEAELKQLARVIAELSKVGKRRSQTSGLAKGKKRQLSSAARERIAAAQRARWAKVRAQSKKAASQP